MAPYWNVVQEPEVSQARETRLALVVGSVLALLCTFLIILGRVHDQRLVAETGVTILPIGVAFLSFAASMKWRVSKIGAGLDRHLIHKKLLIVNGVLWVTLGCTWLGLAASYDTKVRVVLGVVYGALGLALVAKGVTKKRVGED